MQAIDTQSVVRARMLRRRRTSWAGVAAAVTLLPLFPRAASAQYPAGPQITKDGTRVTLTDYAAVPLSGRGASPDLTAQLSRANFLRSEPAGAPLAAGRFFVNDLNSNLYVLNKSSRAFAPYLNFASTFPHFDNDTGFAGGLVTFAFDPAYSTNGRLYTVHTENPALTGSDVPNSFTGFSNAGYTTTTPINPPAGSVAREAVLVEWTDTNLNNASFEGTAREVLRVGFNTNIHPLGDLLFNPNAAPGSADYGNMYVSMGDGGAGESNANDDGVTGVTTGDRHFIPQRIDALNGKILRITPDLSLRPADMASGNGRYRIPTTGSDPNPFNDGAGPLREEIYAHGFRNPHRMVWDGPTDRLIVSDIGLHSWEELNFVTKGKNYGYASREGPEQLFVTTGAGNGQTHGQRGLTFPSPDTLGALRTGTGTTGTETPVYPVAAYSHRDGDAISSGFVYRGSRIPALQGKFVFGDITNARLFYADLADLVAADDGVRLTMADIHEIQITYNGADRRLFDIIADTYTARGGDAPGTSRLPGSADTTAGNDPSGVPYGGGRADIRLTLGDDGELYLISKSDGMIRAIVPEPSGLALVVAGVAVLHRRPRRRPE